MQKASEQQWLVTGANGNLGRRFVVATLSSTQDRIRAVVRSARAAKQLTAIELTAEQRGRLDVRVLDYTDQEGQDHAIAAAAAAAGMIWFGFGPMTRHPGCPFILVGITARDF